MTANPPEVLSGIRVADFTHAGVGPVTTKVLADAGAEVVKVETTLRTEVIRRATPFKQGVVDVEASAQFACYNPNKLGSTINLKHPQGVELARRLIAISDVVADSFTPGVMDRLGLGYADNRRVRPDIIQISMSFAGATGPAKNYRGHGPVLQALAGLSHLTGWPERPPMAPGIAYTDYYVPQLWALSVMSALVYRRRAGKGQFIDGSDFEAAVDLQDTAILDYQVNGNIQTRRGNRHPAQAPHGLYRCRPYQGPDAVGTPAPGGGEERWLALAVQTDAEWEALRKALGDPAWAREARYETLLGRLNHQEEIDGHLAAWTAQRSAEEAMRLLQQQGVRAGAVQNARDFHSDPQLKHRQHFWELEDDPDRQWFTYEASAYRLSETPIRLKRPFPHLGQHNDYVFGELLGLSDMEFAELVEQGAIK